jgi:hypothetical protein
LMLVMPISIASTTVNIKNIVKESDKSLVGNTGLPDLIIEDIYSEYTPDITYYYLTARNIGDSDTVGSIHVIVNYTAQWILFGIIPTLIKIRQHVTLSLSGQGAILSPGEPLEICFIRDFYHEYKNFKLSFSAEINFDHAMEESNYDNNFYEEVISLSIPNSKPSKMGSITFHVFKDLDNDKMFDANEPSPLWAVVNLKKEGGINRFRFVVFSGVVTYRFVLYPYNYHLFANYFYCPLGLGVEDWTYDGTLRLDENNIGSTVYVPLNYTYTPGP